MISSPTSKESQINHNIINILLSSFFPAQSRPRTPTTPTTKAPIFPFSTFIPTAAFGVFVGAFVVVCPATAPWTLVLVCTTVLPAGFVVVCVTLVVPVGVKLAVPAEAVSALAVLKVVVVKEQLRRRSLTSAGLLVEMFTRK